MSKRAGSTVDEVKGSHAVYVPAEGRRRDHREGGTLRGADHTLGSPAESGDCGQSRPECFRLPDVSWPCGWKYRRPYAGVVFLGGSTQAVQHEIEYIEIAKLPAEGDVGVLIAQGARKHEIDVAIREPAVRTEAHAAEFG
jgi:hypothetical protein